MSGCMTKAWEVLPPLTRRGKRGGRWTTCQRDSPGGWVRWRGVLVPDPCLSGAAVFTVRKEAVNCVCSHLSKTEQLLTPPYRHTERERGMQYISEDRKQQQQENENFFNCLHSASRGPSAAASAALEWQASSPRARRWLTELSIWGIQFPPGVKSLWLASKGWLHSWPGHELTTLASATPHNHRNLLKIPPPDLKKNLKFRQSVTHSVSRWGSSAGLRSTSCNLVIMTEFQGWRKLSGSLRSWACLSCDLMAAGTPGKHYTTAYVPLVQLKLSVQRDIAGFIFSPQLHWAASPHFDHLSRQKLWFSSTKLDLFWTGPVSSSLVFCRWSSGWSVVRNNPK